MVHVSKIDDYCIRYAGGLLVKKH